MKHKVEIAKIAVMLLIASITFGVLEYKPAPRQSPLEPTPRALRPPPAADPETFSVTYRCVYLDKRGQEIVTVDATDTITAPTGEQVSIRCPGFLGATPGPTTIYGTKSTVWTSAGTFGASK